MRLRRNPDRNLIMQRVEGSRGTQGMILQVDLISFCIVKVSGGIRREIKVL